MKIKKFVAGLLCIAMTITIFAQTKVDVKKLGKTLEKNKDSSAIFESEINLSQMKISGDTITFSEFEKNKLQFVKGMDFTKIQERISYSNKYYFLVTFTPKDLSQKIKVYAITNIDGIESVSEYNARLAEEARIVEERRIAEEKRRAEEAKRAEERRIAEEKRRAEEERIRKEKERQDNLTKLPVQVINFETVNLSGAESAWLPGQIQDKLKSNLQEYIGMKTVVDSKSEAAIKKLQRESESAARDENSAIELGKITTAKFALFTKIRKTNSGYIISADFTDLTTGEQMASITSKEYSKTEYLYGSTGAIDELTLLLAEKLKLEISELNKNLLASGSASFSLDDQIALAKQNEENFKKQMSDYESQIAALNTSSDLNAIQNKKRIEAEKALLVEKQNAEKKRQQELLEQKQRAEADAKLEAERSIALKTQRDQMAKDAAAKAAEVRKLKLKNQGILGQIGVLESKKKALVEIRQSVESRCQELYDQLVADRKSEENRIRNKNFTTVELGSNGEPTAAALKRRENQVIKSYEDLTNKFFADCDSVKKAASEQDASLLAEIRNDQNKLSKTKTVSSMGEELKVSFGTYEGSKNGWNAYLSLYSDGVLLYTDNFIVTYEALSGKKAPNMETELNDAVIEEYTNNVDMYNSLLVNGTPLVYFELDFRAASIVDDWPSMFRFYFDKIRVINIMSGKIVQNSNLDKKMERTMKPEWDLREIK